MFSDKSDKTRKTFAGKNITDSDFSERPNFGTADHNNPTGVYLYLEPWDNSCRSFFFFTFTRKRHKRINFDHIKNTLDFMSVHLNRGRSMISHKVFRDRSDYPS